MTASDAQSAVPAGSAYTECRWCSSKAPLNPRGFCDNKCERLAVWMEEVPMEEAMDKSEFLPMSELNLILEEIREHGMTDAVRAKIAGCHLLKSQQLAIDETVAERDQQAAPPAKGERSMEHDNEMRGVLFKNKRKVAGDKRPDYTGTLTINGIEYERSAWIRTMKKTGEKYLWETIEIAGAWKTAKEAGAQAADNDRDIPF